MERYADVKLANLERTLESLTPGAVSGTAGLRPLLLHLEITTRCNLRCLKCGHATDPPGSERISPRHLAYSVIETFDEFFAAAAKVHTFGYGEMFLYSKLQRLVQRLKSHDCVVDGITNGALVGEEEINWLVEFGYDELTFSIDGVEAATMQRLRGVDVERLWATLSYLRDRKREKGADRPRVVVNFVAQADNYHELPDLVRKLTDLDIYFIGVNTLHRPDSTSSDSYFQLYREYSLRNVSRHDVEQVFARAEKLAHQASIGFASYVDWEGEYGQPVTELVQLKPASNGHTTAEISDEPPSLPPFYCAHPWMSVYVHADTSVRVCCFMQGSVGAASSGEELESVWNGERITEIRNAVRKGEVHPACRKCVQAGRYKGSFLELEDIRRTLT